MARKAFTVAEANALLPLLEEVLDRMDAVRRRAREHQDRLQVLDLLWGEQLLDPGNPDRAEADASHAALVQCTGELQRLVRREMLDRGLRFPQGGLEQGLVDFPTLWEGRWVYLCWQRGEPELTAWHEVDAGYAGRRPITPEQARRMGREDDPEAVDDSMLDI